MIDTTYYFPQGIPGFEANKEFRLVEEEDVPLAQLISVEDDGIGFILMRPEVLFSDYSVELDAENIATLKLKPAIEETTDSSVQSEETKHLAQTEVWAIVTLNQQDMTQTTFNLRAPILLNTEKKLGVQLILSDDRYLTRQPIILDKLLVQEQEGVAG